jgi:hypothetical protein
LSRFGGDGGKYLVQLFAVDIEKGNDVGSPGVHRNWNIIRHIGDNGLTYSDMNANYQVFPEEVLAVAPTGEVDAVRPGEATILYQNGGITAEKKVTVVNSLSEFVRIDIHVHVPEPVLESESLAYHYFTRQKLELQKSGPTDYCGTISVPRDWEFDGYIARETAQSIKRKVSILGKCHCTPLLPKLAFAHVCELQEVKVGTVLEFE